MGVGQRLAESVLFLTAFDMRATVSAFVFLHLIEELNANVCMFRHSFLLSLNPQKLPLPFSPLSMWST